MEITEEQYARIKDSLLVQRGNVSLTNLQLLNALLYVAEHGCKRRGLPCRKAAKRHEAREHQRAPIKPKNLVL